MGYSSRQDDDYVIMVGYSGGSHISLTTFLDDCNAYNDIHVYNA
jgi:hypothetical protein